MNQSALACALGVTFQQVQKYERGGNRITASRLFEAARVLDLPLDWFFEGVPDGRATPTARPTEIEQFVGRPHALRLARAFNRIGTNSFELGATEVVEAIADASEITSANHQDKNAPRTGR